MCLILNPTIILSTVLAQTVNEFIPPGAVLISLMFFVLVSIGINVRNGIKKYRNETKAMEEENEEKKNTAGTDIESKSINPSKVILSMILYFPKFLLIFSYFILKPISKFIFSSKITKRLPISKPAKQISKPPIPFPCPLWVQTTLSLFQISQSPKT